MQHDSSEVQYPLRQQTHEYTQKQCCKQVMKKAEGPHLTHLAMQRDSGEAQVSQHESHTLCVGAGTAEHHEGVAG